MNMISKNNQWMWTREFKKIVLLNTGGKWELDMKDEQAIKNN